MRIQIFIHFWIFFGRIRKNPNLNISDGNEYDYHIDTMRDDITYREYHMSDGTTRLEEWKKKDDGTSIMVHNLDPNDKIILPVYHGFRDNNGVMTDEFHPKP